MKNNIFKLVQKYLFFIKNASLRNVAIVYESDDEDDDEENLRES
jgi:hypothetical protein